MTIYAVRGLIEYLLTIKKEGVSVKIHFKGGCMGTNGVQPGKYATSSCVETRLIEESPEYKSGKIYRYHTL